MGTILRRIWNAISSIETGYSIVGWFAPEPIKAITGIIVMLEVASISLFSGKDPATIVVFSLAAGAFIIWLLNGIIWMRSGKIETAIGPCNENRSIKAEISITPHPTFDCPFQGGDIDRTWFLSWWHIPVWLEIIQNPSVRSYEHCTVKLRIERIYPDGSYPAEKPKTYDMRCQSRDGAIAEFALRMGG